MRLLLLVVAALLLPGCASPSAPVETAAASDEGANEGAATPAADAGAPNQTATATSGALYMLADGTLSLAPPTEEAAVPVDTVTNTPISGGSPEWTGVIPVDIDANTTITLTVYLTTSSVSVPARTVPEAFGFPGIGAYFSIGEGSIEASAPGPDVMVRGDVSEIVMTFPYVGDPVEAGAQMSVEIVPYYSHVQTVADVQFVMGPSHLAGVAFDHASS